jgi:hypothetical protein
MRRRVRIQGRARGITAGVVAAVTAGFGCGRSPAPPPDDSAPLIHAAVLRYQAKQFLSEERLPLCVALHGSTGVEARVRDALQPTVPDVRAAEACVIVDGDVYLAGSRVPAALLTSGPIRWIAEDEAEVRGGFTRTRSSSQRPVYRVVRDGGRWVCLGPVVTGVPL